MVSTALLVLLVAPPPLRAQASRTTLIYQDAAARYQLRYPITWQLSLAERGEGATFAPGAAAGGATAPMATLSMQPLPDRQKNQKLTTRGAVDSLWLSLRQLPQAQVLAITQRDSGRFEEVRYDYTYASAPGGSRLHVVGRRVWRGGYEFRVEYQAETSQDSRYLAQGQQLVESFAFTGKAVPSRRYADQVCDDKMYGIAAMRRRNGQWEDDCRTIHEFSTTDVTASPVVHRQALPFQSYALAKGFDNALYSVTKAPTDAPERVYRYDPATRQGRYTPWTLPAQGRGNVWISAATDDQGYLYFVTSDAHKMVKVSPFDGSTTVLWTTDPIQQAPYYPLIGFESAGTHGNFCLDDGNTLYQVYSTDGSLLKVDLKTRRPAPDMMPLTGLPRRGGYSDLLMQNDEAGRRRLYLAGPKGLYKVDLARRHATFVRGGTYTDLAGCNLFRVLPRPVPPPPPGTKATWKGRVLNAATLQPLPQAYLRVESAQARTAVPLRPGALFAYTAPAGLTYKVHAELAGYLMADTTWTAAPGPYVRDVLLRPLAVGTTLPLPNVQFAQGQAILLATSYPALDQLARLLLDNPHMTIELRGHTDNVGSPEKNVVLSEQRVGTVKAYLVAHGVDDARIAGRGLGGTEPLASNDQEMTRKLNRRVEFKVTGMR